MHGCGSLPSVTDGNSHTQLPRRLAHSGPFRGSLNIAQDPPPQPLRLPGAQGQLCQEHTVIQSASIVPGHSYRLSADDCLSGVSHDDSASRDFLQGRYRLSTRSFPENAGPYGSSFTSTSVGSASHATHPVPAEAEGSIRDLASRMLTRNGDLGLCIGPGPLEGPTRWTHFYKGLFKTWNLFKKIFFWFVFILVIRRTDCVWSKI